MWEAMAEFSTVTAPKSAAQNDSKFDRLIREAADASAS